MHAFCRNGTHFELLYSGFLSSNVQTFYRQKFSCLFFLLKGYVFCVQDPDIRSRLMVTPPCSNFRIITANFLGIQIFRIFCCTVQPKVLQMTESTIKYSASEGTFMPVRANTKAISSSVRDCNKSLIDS